MGHFTSFHFRSFHFRSFHFVEQLVAVPVVDEKHWQIKMFTTLRQFVVDDSQVKQLVGAQFHQGRQPGPKRKGYPIATFDIIRVRGTLDAYNGVLRIWAWSSSHEEEAEKIYRRVEDIIHHIKLSGEGLETVYTSRNDSLGVFNEQFQLNVWTGTFSFRAFHLEKC